MTNYIKTKTGYVRPCWKCGGDGIYWMSGMTANGPAARKDTCYPCDGTGLSKKVFATLADLAEADARNEKARANRDAKQQAEWESKRGERELELARLEQVRLEQEAENNSWSYLDGQIGDKVTVTGTISVAASIETQYGTSRLIVVETEDRKAVKLFTSAEWSWTAELTETVTITGAIKSFDEFNGRLQTQLVRPKLEK